MKEYLKCGAKNKFFVINLDKAEEKMHEKDLMDIEFGINEIVNAVSNYSEMQNKEYLVINTDEPYIDEIIEILKKNNHFG